MCHEPKEDHAQEAGPKLALGDVGIGIGDVVRLDGLRLNYRDMLMERVRGVSVTIELGGNLPGLAVGGLGARGWRQRDGPDERAHAF